MSKIKKQAYAFEEDYFEGYFKGIADFSLSRNKEIYNWFKGIFNYLDHLVPLKNGKNKKALEFGCATGSAAKVLSDWGFEVTATDVSKYAVSRASKLYPQINFFVQDIQKPLKIKSKFDLTFAFDVIEHLENPEIAIKNMLNVLNPGGIVICSTPDESKSSGDPSHINVKKPEAWKRIFQKVGFNDIIIRQVTLVPYFYRWHWRLNFAIPFVIPLPLMLTPVFIIAKR